jgi:murein DD-endopeptidase MepM/ murein hydrolase activator NlpD
MVPIAPVKKVCIILVSLLLAAVSSAREGAADIYRLDSGDDVVTFTDTPNDRRYQRVQKELPSRTVSHSRGQGQAAVKKTESLPGRDDSGLTGRSLPVAGVITSTTGFRNDPFNGKLTHHNGLDIAAPSGTPVKPVAPGTVIFSGWKKGYGNTVILEHEDGMVTVYAHHSRNSVSEGERVDLGSVIAATGSTGRSTGPHLHFEAWRNGTNITPDFMPGSSSGSPATASSSAPIRRFLQSDGTLLFTNLN